MGRESIIIRALCGLIPTEQDECECGIGCKTPKLEVPGEDLGGILALQSKIKSLEKRLEEIRNLLPDFFRDKELELEDVVGDLVVDYRALVAVVREYIGKHNRSLGGSKASPARCTCMTCKRGRNLVNQE
jgi:hypothetical protein